MNEIEVQELENDIGSWDWLAELENRVPAISAAQLMEKPIEPREYVVRGLLPQGLSILGGTPKIGKSWFVLDLCLHVATGEPFLGLKGTAWYISLEDTPEHLYHRLGAITEVEPDNLFFTTEEDGIGTMADTLEKHIHNFIKQHPDTVQFQPTLYRLISALATKEEFSQMQESQKMQIYQSLGSHEKQVEYLLRQDGKTREEYSSDLSRKLLESLQDLRNTKAELEQTCRKWVLITAAVSMASSTLACVLCLLLAG